MKIINILLALCIIVATVYIHIDIIKVNIQKSNLKTCNESVPDDKICELIIRNKND